MPSKGRNVPDKPTATFLETVDHWSLENNPEVLEIGEQGFKDVGRGAVVIHESDTPATYTPSIPAGAHGILSKVAYIPLDNPVGWPDEETRRMVETYDPSYQVVAVFVRTNGHTSAYKVRRAPSPSA